MICLTLSAPDFEENLKAVAAYREWTDMLELRVDRLRHDLVPACAAFMNQTFADFGVPFLLTIRLIEDGGAWAHGEDERRAAFATILARLEPGVLAWVDLEATLDWPDVESAARLAGAGIIRSYHNFSGTPANLEAMMKDMYRNPGDVVKAAVMARGSIDLLAIFTVAENLRTFGRPFILLGMGPFGVPSRILARKLGSMVTYASSALQGHVAAAPGHMDPKLLCEQFAFHEMGAQTRIFGIIGNPVMHSRSPAFHNARFREAGIDAVYLPFQVDHLPSFFTLADRLGIRGISVTIPHKEGVVSYLHSADDLVEQIGSCNTLVRRADGWHGTNTDAPGFFLPLTEMVRGEKPDRAVVIGAGGAARGVVQALLAAGFSVLVLNRSVDRARHIAQDFEKWYPGMVRAELLPSDSTGSPPTTDVAGELMRLIQSYTHVIVQTTSIGMDNHEEIADPFAFYEFTGAELVYDIIYTPPLTPLLQRAQQAGCRILNGLPMFEEQARLQSAVFLEAAGQTSAVSPT